MEDAQRPQAPQGRRREPGSTESLLRSGLNAAAVVVILLQGGRMTPMSVNKYCEAVVLGGYTLTAIIIILIGTLIIREQVLPK